MRKRRIILIFIAVIIICALLALLLPKSFPKTSLDDIDKIKVFNGNTGKTVVIDDEDEIEYIVTQLKSTKYVFEGPALGMGTSFHLNFVDSEGTTKEVVIVQFYDQLKIGNAFYKVTKSGAINDLFDFLEEVNGFEYRDSLR